MQEDSEKEIKVITGENTIEEENKEVIEEPKKEESGEEPKKSKKRLKIIIIVLCFIALNIFALLFGVLMGKEEENLKEVELNSASKSLEEKIDDIAKDNIIEFNCDGGRLTIEEDIKRVQKMFSEKDSSCGEQVIQGVIEKTEEMISNGELVKASENYEKLIEAGLYTPSMIDKFLTINLKIPDYKKAFSVYMYILKISNYPPELTGTPIAKNDISNNIVKKQEELQMKQDSGNYKDLDQLYVELAQLYYDASDYYYYLDNKKHSYVIIFNNLLSYEMLEKATLINPDNPEIYYIRGRLYDDTGIFYDLAEAEIKKAIALKDDDYRYYYRLGNAYRGQKNHELAKQSYIKGIALNNNYEKLHLNLGNAYYELGEREKSDKSYYNGIEVCEKKCGGLYFNMGYHLFLEEKYKEALTLFDKSIDIEQENDPKSYRYRGKTYFQLGNYNKALEDLNISVLGGEKDDRVDESYYYLGRTYYSLGKYELSKSYFDKAIAIGTDLNANRWLEILKQK